MYISLYTINKGHQPLALNVKYTLFSIQEIEAKYPTGERLKAVFSSVLRFQHCLLNSSQDL